MLYIYSVFFEFSSPQSPCEVNMPVLKVYGLTGVERDRLVVAYGALKAAATMVEGLRLRIDQVSVFFVPDLLDPLPTSRDFEIVVFIDGLLDLPERTPEIRTALAAKIEECLKSLFPTASLVEVFVRPAHAKEDRFPI
jgi:hypothetical protein